MFQFRKAFAATGLLVAAAAFSTPAAQAADGYVYAWNNYNYNTNQGWCAWYGNDRDWSWCDERSGGTTSMRNKASSLWNNGYAGAYPAVNFYYNGPERSSAWACLGQGDSWPDLRYRYFSWGSGLPGYGRPLENDIAGHKWVQYCGHA